MKKIIFSIILVLFVLGGISAQGDPPPVAAPSASNAVLVDRLIELANYERYFFNYCTLKVNEHASKNGWTNAKSIEILGSIKFNEFKFTIYNAFAFCSKEQLEALINAFTLLSKDPDTNPKMVLMNSMMQNNLDIYVESVIQGKYVTKK